MANTADRPLLTVATRDVAAAAAALLLDASWGGQASVPVVSRCSSPPSIDAADLQYGSTRISRHLDIFSIPGGSPMITSPGNPKPGWESDGVRISTSGCTKPDRP